jgi:hypothetical protein
MVSIEMLSWSKQVISHPMENGMHTMQYTCVRDYLLRVGPHVYISMQ